MVGNANIYICFMFIVYNRHKAYFVPIIIIIMVPTYVNIIILKANIKIWQFNENWSVIGQWSYIIKFTCVITKKNNKL